MKQNKARDIVKKSLSVEILPPTTAGIYPEKFGPELFFAQNRTVTVIVLVLFIVIGFALRVNQLGWESLSEDELNKLQTVQDYRTNGLTGKNGEHPFLMKGLQTVSIIAAEKLNNYVLAPRFEISDETALRFPVALFGTFSTLLIFLLVRELFGRSIGLISAALWAVEPMAIGFDRIAKEDSLALFFFLLTNLFWIRGQTAAERGRSNWLNYAWATAASFGALLASKYYPFLFPIIGAYYAIFQYIPGQKWGLGKKRWLKFMVIMFVAFLVLNPTIFLPETWREILIFSSERRIGHNSYEFFGNFYPNQVSYWLAGVPWTFYYVFIAVKTSLLTLALFMAGLPIMFRRRLGDGRFFVFMWAFFWFMPFTFLGGKFTRYFAVAEPLVLIPAAVCSYYLMKWVSNKFVGNPVLVGACQIILFAVVVAFPLYNSIEAAPHFRLFTNAIGASLAPVGSYFPHDEFYDASTREIVARIGLHARPQAVVACETPTLYEYYAHRSGRDDLTFISLSDRSKVDMLAVGDFVVAAAGRKYLSNTAYADYLENSSMPVVETRITGITSADVYQLDARTVAGLHAIATQ